MRAVFSEHRYLSLDDPAVRSRVLSDPFRFLDGTDPLILDEVQGAPDLLRFLPILRGNYDRPGQFILTASQSTYDLRLAVQALSDQTVLLRLYPFSLAELRGLHPLDPTTLDRTAWVSDWARPSDSAPVSDPAPASALGESLSADGLWQTLVTGFYPPVHDKGTTVGEWFGDYLRNYIERDLRRLTRVRDLATFETFMRLAAARTATGLSLNSLASDSGVTQQTASRWLKALQHGHLTMTLRPHHANYRKRLRKRPRLHFLDSGLICYLLGIRNATDLEAHPLRGAIFESFVTAELVKAFAAVGRDPPLFYWRDATGHEIDVLIDAGDRLIPLEVRSGRTVPADAAAALQWWTSIPSNPNRGGVLVHGGAERSRLKEFRVLPWFLTGG